MGAEKHGSDAFLGDFPRPGSHRHNYGSCWVSCAHRVGVSSFNNLFLDRGGRVSCPFADGHRREKPSGSPLVDVPPLVLCTHVMRAHETPRDVWFQVASQTATRHVPWLVRTRTHMHTGSRLSRRSDKKRGNSKSLALNGYGG